MTRTFFDLFVILLIVLCGGTESNRGIAQDTVAIDPALQGQWTRVVKTSNGLVTMVKQHSGNRSIVTAYDDKQNVIYSHESVFDCEDAGKVKIFTFSQRKVTAGPGKGQVFPEPVSFIYRIADGKFIEVHGVLENDKNPPNMIIWKRLEREAA